jgi:putative ABC transport system permease protein
MDHEFSIDLELLAEK